MVDQEIPIEQVLYNLLQEDSVLGMILFEWAPFPLPTVPIQVLRTTNKLAMVSYYSDCAAKPDQQSLQHFLINAQLTEKKTEPHVK